MSTHDQPELSIVRDAAGFVPAQDSVLLRITGSDATRWLNGMVSNSIQSLRPGEGNYNFLLNAQGHILGDAMVYREPEPEPPTFLLTTTASQMETIRGHLDRFIIMDDVEVQPAEDYPAGLLILGRQAAGTLAALSLPIIERSRLALTDTQHGRLLLLSPARGETPVYELRSTPATIAGVQSALQRLHVPQISSAALEWLRLLEARPLFGKDIRNTETAHDLPQETAQQHALHFAKGCYLGQEIVERIRSRGQVHRRFTAFRLQGELPATLPAPLEMDGKPAGELTSAGLAPLPEGPALLGLGYLRQAARKPDLGQEASGAAQPLTYPGGVALPRQGTVGSG
jgi:folate-binding protein YgfZ